MTLKNIILVMALPLLGLKPSSNLQGQVLDTLACLQADSIFQKTNFRKDPRKSIPRLEKALSITGGGKCDVLYIKSLNSLAASYYFLREYIDARYYAQQATDFSKTYFGENSGEYATSIANLAIFIEEMGNYRKSIELQLKSLQIAETFDDNPLTLAAAKENLGLSYMALGDFDLARSYYEQALKNLDEAEKKTRLTIQQSARLKNEMATSAWAQGDVEEAKVLLLESLEILKPLPAGDKYLEQTRWFVYKDLAEWHLDQHQLDEALTYIRKTLDLQEEYKVNNAYRSYLTMGDIQLKRGDQDQALSYYQQASEIAAEEYAIYKKHPALAAPVTHQANVYTQSKAYPKALEYYDKAYQLITTEEGEFAQPLAALDVLDGRTETLYQHYLETREQQKLKTALQDCQRITQLLQEIRYSVVSDDPKNSLTERAVPIIERGIAIAMELYQHSENPAYLEQAFTFAESNKALLLYESMRETAARGGAGIPDSLLEKGEKLQDGLSYLKRQLLEEQQKKASDGSEDIQKWKSELFKIEEDYRKWIAQMEEDYPLYYEQKYKTDPVSAEVLRPQLKEENSAVIAFMLGPNQAYVFCLSAEKLAVFPLGKSAALITAANQLRQLISSPPSGSAFKDNYQAFIHQSASLYQQLLEASLSTLPPTVRHLTIIPDDVLSLLPFELLLRQPPSGQEIDFSPDHLDYLFEDYTISYDYSASLMNVLQLRRRSEGATKTFIGFAPSFGEETVSGSRACTENNLYSLRCNGEEVRAIHALLGGEALQAGAARLDAFREKAHHYQIVHLATHACVDEETAALSKIYFTDANLTPYELNNLHFNADLTVLSACNTGGGKVLRGEGVISLARSFMLAGSQSVLTSLWSVDDCATSDMMVHYYQGLKEGQSKAEALGRAKLNYLKTADVYSRHPSYWAAFVQFGDIEKMDLNPSAMRWYLLTLVAVLFIFLLVKLFFQTKKKGFTT